MTQTKLPGNALREKTNGKADQFVDEIFQKGSKWTEKEGSLNTQDIYTVFISKPRSETAHLMPVTVR